jgi:hypothetical protein
MNAHLSLSSTIVLRPRRAGLCAGKDKVIEILVRIQAPDAPVGHEAQRPPQALALVIGSAEDLMEPFQQALELLGNFCLRDLRLSATAPDGFGVEVANRFLVDDRVIQLRLEPTRRTDAVSSVCPPQTRSLMQ